VIFINVVIIDTGVSLNENVLHLKSVNGITITKKIDGYDYSAGFKDNIGHGTIVTNILLSHLESDINLFVIKIFDTELNIDKELLVEALHYCDFKLNCDIVQISLGSLYSDKNLMTAIETLTAKGIIIISAFDNDKCISYPAAYEDVIGVDVTQDYKRIEQYNITENNVIDIQGADIYHRTIGLDEKRIIVRGSSFYCSYVTAMLIKSNIQIGKKKSYINMLKNTAEKVFTITPIIKTVLQIKKAVIFPFNKEIHSLAAFEQMIPFHVSAYYDLRQRGMTNKCIKDILPYTSNVNVIAEFNNIDWDSEFDTFICGHVGVISKMIGYDILKEILDKCNEYGKQLICFDNALSYLNNTLNMNMWFPYMDQKSIPKYRFGKLRSPNVPIVGVFGTSSQQGKMTIQLMLREAFMKKGIKVKNIGSEPESLLFGFEFAYVFGYESTDLLQPNEMVQVLNEAVYNLEKDDCDIIIAGSQSGTVPHQLRNLNMIPSKQYFFLLGTQPDSIILCVNGYDSEEYISRTISIFKAAVNANVICLVVSYINARKNKLDTKPLSFFEEHFGLPVFDLQSVDIDKMTEIIQNYYG
jgi:hypothetical protein